MPSSVYLGIDVGTSSVKVVATMRSGGTLSAEVSYALSVLSDGGVEEFPERWWQATRVALGHLWHQGADPRQLAGIAVSGHGCTLVPLGANGELLGPAIGCLDRRCRTERHQIAERAETRIADVHGNDVTAFPIEPKLLWLKAHRPEWYELMRVFLTPTSYLNFQLTGRAVMNVSDAGLGLAYDRMQGMQWNHEIIAAMGLDAEKFPAIALCHQVIGGVHAKAARTLGIPANTPVLAGGEDTSAVAVASGISHAGNPFLSTGTQGIVGVAVEGLGRPDRLLAFPHMYDQLSLVTGSIGSFGGAVQWFLRQCAPDWMQAPDPLTVFFTHAKQSPPGSRGVVFLPYLAGELHPLLNEDAAAVFFGLQLQHSRSDMARAILEATGYAVRHNLESLAEILPPNSELQAAGKPTRNALWCQILADITQCPLTIREVRTSSERTSVEVGAPLGMSLWAQAYVGSVSIEKLVDAWTTEKASYEPNAELAPLYTDRYGLYRELYRRLADLFLTTRRGRGETLASHSTVAESKHDGHPFRAVTRS